MRVVLIEVIFILFFSTCAFANDYFVDASSGKDESLGTSKTSPWKSLKKINSVIFNPGDKICLKRGETWEEALIIPNSGTEDMPITFGAYGQGPNPLIKCSSPFSDWILQFEDHGKIWKGTGSYDPQGAIKEGRRLPQYIGSTYKGNNPGKKKWDAPVNLRDMKNGFFYAPDKKNTFYLRWDNGNPGEIEVGKRKYGIYIKNKKYLIVDSIDVTGPSGNNWSGSRQIIVDNSDNIYLKNSKLSHHNNGGIIVRNGSTKCILENITSHGHRSTGIYFWEAGGGNKAINCEVYECGSLQSDHGDMGLIGIWKTPGVLIENCYVHDNGNEDIKHIDAAISFVQSIGGRVERCNIENAGGTAVQFAEASDNAFAAYNIIDSWGTHGADGKNEGIRIGGGVGPTARNCGVFNNLFINGGKTPGRWAALRIVNQNNAGLQVKNNIFYNNIGVFEVIAESKELYKAWHFSHNLYFRTEGVAIEMAGKKFSYQQLLGDALNTYPIDKNQELGSLAVDPEINFEKMVLEENSPCIDAGVYVGVNKDYYGKPVPAGKTKVDIGPFEYHRGN